MAKKKTALTADDVKKIARLARLHITGTEVKIYASQLSEILNYFSKLKEVNTDKVNPTFSTAGQSNRFQEQKLESDRLDRKEALRNAKDTENGYVRTKAVIEN